MSNKPTLSIPAAQIPGYEGLYDVGADGSVISFHRGRIRSLSTKRSKGYPAVTLSKNGHHKTALVHRLVASAFIPNPRNLPEVNHKDGNKQNNEASNLEWVLPIENIEHSVKNGLWRPHFGMKNGMRKKTHCPQGHEYSGENVRVVAGKRRCMTCVRAQQKLVRERRKAKERGIDL